MAHRSDPRRRPIRLIIGSMLLVFSAMPPAAAQTDPLCTVPGMNMQCSEFGTISVPNQIDMRGGRVTLEVDMELYTSFPAQDARWMLFAVRHVPESGSSPIDLRMESFSSEFGDMLIEKVEQPTPNELNIWVHVLDTPVRIPFTLVVDVGSSDRGAFRLEALVMPFDRGYDTIQGPDGQDRLLYSFTLLGVNDESAKQAVAGASNSTPVGSVALVSILAAAFVLWRRRR